MKRLEDYIAEMSAVRNRENIAIADDIRALYMKMAANDFEDKKRIMKAAGVTNGKAYDAALAIARIILESNNKTGAVYYVLLWIQSKMEKYADVNKKPKIAEVYDKITSLLEDSVIAGANSKNEQYSKTIEKLEEMRAESNKMIAELNKLQEKLFDMECDYPAIDYYKPSSDFHREIHGAAPF